MHGAHGTGVGVGPLVAHYAYAHHWKKHGEALPDLRVEPGSLDLGDDDFVCLLEKCDALGCDLAEDTHRETGAGERLAT